MQVALPVLLALACLACHPDADRHPNVLLLVVDTLRADHTSLLGYERATTPRLDAFARDALVFENARASSSWTKPSMASLLTGLSVSAHGVEADEARLPEAATTLAEALWTAGYRTALLSDNPYVSRPFGLAQGYEQIVDYAGGDGESALREHRAADWVQRSGAVALNAQLLEWIDGIDTTQSWFAHVHYMEPHWPYRPPPTFHRRFATSTETPVKLTNLWEVETGIASFVPGLALSQRDRQNLIDAYDAAIAFWDDRFGALLHELERRGRLADTLVAVVSDHGEAFYEHATWAHQNSLYDELVHVPLVLAGPGVEPGRDARHVASSDLPSTLLQLAGLDPADIGSGRSLLGPEVASWTARLARKGRHFHATIEDGRKWIVAQGDETERVEAFGLADDPRETRDRSSELPARATGVRARLLQRAQAERAAGLESATSTPSDEMESALRALGYLR